MTDDLEQKNADERLPADRCSRCRAFRPGSFTTPDPDEQLAPKPLGECHRRPPMRTCTQPSIWPQVSPDDWCSFFVDVATSRKVSLSDHGARPQ